MNATTSGPSAQRSESRTGPSVDSRTRSGNASPTRRESMPAWYGSASAGPAGPARQVRLVAASPAREPLAAGRRELHERRRRHHRVRAELLRSHLALEAVEEQHPEARHERGAERDK